jgi:hypothetical protein
MVHFKKLAAIFGALVWIVGLVPTVWSQAADQDEAAYFETQVRPLLAQRCFACHSRRSNMVEGDLLLDSAEGWLRGGARGRAIDPTDVRQSLVSKAIRYNDPDLQMPPAEKLSDREIAVLERWMEKGAPFPIEARGHDDLDPSDPVAGKRHWAYQPLRRRTLPRVGDSEWTKSFVDYWIFSALEREGLRPVLPAKPIDLLRRVTFGLVGLPPSPEQQASYLADPTDAAFERLVDHLLSSPEFGRRWGRHWLDLARYADSNGLDENFLFREAWRYRNWVIDAVNADMPLDQFLLEQIAGDLLPYSSLEERDRQRIAAGFLVVGPKVLLGVNPKRQRMDVADEQLETIGRTVLGQTLGCARCHDHKFDPIPTMDYYAMAGILTSTNVMEKRYMLNEQRVMERLVGLGPDGEALDDAYERYWRDEHPQWKTRMDKAKAVLEVLKKGNGRSFEESLAKDAPYFAEIAKSSEVSLEDRIAAQEALVKELGRERDRAPSIPPRAMIPADMPTPGDEPIRHAGKFDEPRAVVPRGFLRVLLDQEPPPIAGGQSGRIELARWLTARDQRSGWLAARVQANRVWHHLMGRGLVRTVDNFGRTGEAPTHPELLDSLALELIQNDWSTKALIRKIVLSRAYAASSQQDPDNASIDPENRFWWRALRRRLDPESLRDAMLLCAGTLDRMQAESTVSYLGDQATAVGKNLVRRRTDFEFRSVFLPVIRNDLPEIFNVFDFANPQATTGDRPSTNVPMQGLFLLNDESVIKAAEAIAGRLLQESPTASPEDLVQQLFTRVVGRGPGHQEAEAVLSYMREMEKQATAAKPSTARLHALKLACHALLASSQFQYLE